MILTEKECVLLRTIATQSGLTMSDYLRDCIRLKKLKHYNVTIHYMDLDEHTLTIAAITRKITSVCNTISASKVAYPQEVEKLIQLLDEINESNKTILEKFYKDRKKLYLEAKKELMKTFEMCKVF